MIKHSQSTQSNKFAISLQYFEKEVRDGVTIVFYCNAKHSDILRGHRSIQSDLEAGIMVCAPKLGAQKSFLVQYILSSIHSDK